MSLEAWSKGQDYSLVVIRAPKKDEGSHIESEGPDLELSAQNQSGDKSPREYDVGFLDGQPLYQ